MTAATGRLPLREHLRPKPYKRVTTADDVDPWLLATFPNIVTELNSVLVDARVGDDWIVTDIPLAMAVALPCEGQA